MSAKGEVIEILGKKFLKPVVGFFSGLARGGGDDAAKAVARESAEAAARGAVSGVDNKIVEGMISAGNIGSRLKNLLKKGGKYTLLGGGALTGAQIGLNQLGMRGPFDWAGLMGSDSVAVPTGASLATLQTLERPGAGPKASELFQQYLDSQAAARANRPDLPNLVTAFDTQAAAAQNALNNYLATMGGYSSNQAAAIRDAYGRMASNLQKSADDTFTRGQMTAADLENLYSGLAAQQAATAAGAGQATPVSQTAGLAAPSGEMATAPQTTRTYGRGLADYLGREAGIESGAISRTAQSQALQGAGMAQGLQDYLAMKSADLQFQLANNLAQGRTEAQQRQAMMQYERDMADLDFEAQAAQQMMGFQMQEAQQAAAEEQVKYDAAVQAAYSWQTASDEARMQIANSLGINPDSGLEQFVRAVYNNPTLLTALQG